MRLGGRKKLLVLLVILFGLGLVDAMFETNRAEAGLFSRIFGGRRGRSCGRSFSCNTRYYYPRTRTTHRVQSKPKVKVKVKVKVFDFNEFRFVSGTQTLSANEGSLFERDQHGNPIAQLFIDPYSGVLTRRPLYINGRRVSTARWTPSGWKYAPYGAVNPNERVAHDLREFYLRTRQKFVDAVKDSENTNGFLKAKENLTQLDQFLKTYRKRKGGYLALNLKDTFLPKTLITQAGDRAKAMQVAINFILNSISGRNPIPFKILKADGAKDYLALKLGGNQDPRSNWFEDHELDLLTHSNPYSCGDDSVPLRVDWLMKRAMDPDIYYELLGMSTNWENRANQLGIDHYPDRLSRRAKIAVVRTDEADQEFRVGRAELRLIGYEPDKYGRPCYRSYDITSDKVGKYTSEARDPRFTRPENLTYDAMEVICRNPNGFLNFYLADTVKNGNRQANAPANIAAHGTVHPFSANGGGPAVGPASCLECHASGQIGKTHKGHVFDITREAKVRSWGSVYSGPEKRTGKEYYVDNQTYANRANADNAAYWDLLQRTLVDEGDSLVFQSQKREKLYAVVPSVLQNYQNNLTLDQAAKELGVRKSDLRYIVGGLDNNLKRDPKEADDPNAERFISRHDFEMYYCEWKAKAQRLGGGPNPGGYRDPSSVYVPGPQQYRTH